MCVSNVVRQEMVIAFPGYVQHQRRLLMLAVNELSWPGARRSITISHPHSKCDSLSTDIFLQQHLIYRLDKRTTVSAWVIEIWLPFQ